MVHVTSLPALPLMPWGGHGLEQERERISLGAPPECHFWGLGCRLCSSPCLLSSRRVSP